MAQGHPLRWVIDSNVWISGMLSQAGAPAKLTRHVVQNGRPVFSAQTFAELKDRLWRPKFDRYVTIDQRNRLLRDLESMAHWIDVPPEMASQRYSRDASDDMFIHAALVSKAPLLVTGDDDLLCLKRVEGVRIVSSSDAVALLTGGAAS